MRSYYEATARERIGGILDEASWHEILPPTTRTLSPHLAARSIKDLVRASGGLYQPPKRFRNW